MSIPLENESQAAEATSTVPEKRAHSPTDENAGDSKRVHFAGKKEEVKSETAQDPIDEEKAEAESETAHVKIESALDADWEKRQERYKKENEEARARSEEMHRESIAKGHSLLDEAKRLLADKEPDLPHIIKLLTKSQDHLEYAWQAELTTAEVAYLLAQCYGTQGEKRQRVCKLADAYSIICRHINDVKGRQDQVNDECEHTRQTIAKEVKEEVAVMAEALDSGSLKDHDCFSLACAVNHAIWKCHSYRDASMTIDFVSKEQHDKYQKYQTKHYGTLQGWPEELKLLWWDNNQEPDEEELRCGCKCNQNDCAYKIKWTPLSVLIDRFTGPRLEELKEACGGDWDCLPEEARSLCTAWELKAEDKIACSGYSGYGY